MKINELKYILAKIIQINIKRPQIGYPNNFKDKTELLINKLLPRIDIINKPVNSAIIVPTTAPLS